jgi:hypothetical protein
MSKRAVDLSVEELSALGAKAARLAVQKSQSAGLVVTGTVETYEEGQAAFSLAQLLPSGTVTLVRKSGSQSTKNEEPTSEKPVGNRAVD